MRSRFSPGLRDLAIITACFAAALLAATLAYGWPAPSLSAGDLAAGVLVSILAVWFAARLAHHGDGDLWRFFLEQLCLGAGLTLIAQALLAYLFLFSLPTALGVAGSAFAALPLTLVRIRAAPGTASGLLMVGYDSVVREILPALRQPPLGVVSPDSSHAPAGVPWLGEEGQLEQIVSRLHPAHIVIAAQQWASSIPPALLLGFSRSGILVHDSPALYEKRLYRVCAERLRPTDVLLSPALQADSRTMAFQSIYTNLIGLFFLLALAPVMIVIGIAIALFSGRGPVLETIPCLGFHKIPFYLLRFRTRRRDGSGSLNPIGRFISALHLVNLPQLINVVRGEMALVGPRPVRTDFADRLIALMPFYSHRLSVKPGIIGWTQMHVQGEHTPCDESLKIEYDLYYVKQGSPLLDLEIFARTLLGGGPRPRPRGAV
jgi:lipopolysaccharide/colanic/teichoic acid biosynthesis glycosyltransferase